MLILVLPVLTGVAIIAVGHFAGGGEAPNVELHQGAGLRQAVAPAAAGTPAPELRLRDARSGRPFDNSSLDGRPYAVVFLSTRCTAIAPVLRRALDELGGAAGKAAILGISGDPWSDTLPRARSWLSAHREPPTLHYLIGSEAELRPSWSAWGLSVPERTSAPSACTGSVSVHLVSSAGVNAGTVDIDTANAGTSLAKVLGALSK